MTVVPESYAPRGNFALLAPPQAVVPGNFCRVDQDHAWHQRMMNRMQRLRGEIYLQDGAIRNSQIGPDGAHRVPIDDPAWHVLALDDSMRIYGCSRYLAHPNSVKFSQLSVRHSPLATSFLWGSRFRSAVEADIHLARRRGIGYVEVGGWALSPNLRCSVEALRIALATYSLARTLGGCIGIATVTYRHGSSAILRRIGGRPLSVGGVDLPPYYDPQYGCDMEILRFDSSEPNPRFEHWIEGLTDYLRTEPVIHDERPMRAPVRTRIPSFHVAALEAVAV